MAMILEIKVVYYERDPASIKELEPFGARIAVFLSVQTKDGNEEMREKNKLSAESKYAATYYSYQLRI